MNKFERAISKWESIPTKQRTRRVAHELSKSVGMRSMLEVFIARDLEYLKQQGHLAKWDYECETWDYQHDPQTYTPDFKVVLPNSTIQYYEAKGKMTDQTRKKLLSIKRCNPDKDLKIIFERSNNKLKAGGKMTYATWADKYKLPWSEKEIKETWYAE